MNKGFEHLQLFGRRAVDILLEDQIRMVYRKQKEDGLWKPDKKKIQIRSELVNKAYENLVILHEWLHAYEDLIIHHGITGDLQLAIDKASPEQIIDHYAVWHCRTSPDLVDYIRGNFKDENF